MPSTTRPIGAKPIMSSRMLSRLLMNSCVERVFGPAMANETNRALGCRPSSAAFSSDMTRTAAAPSEIWELLPAVTTPSDLKAG